MQVRPGDEHYAEMFAAYKNNKGARFNYNNVTWMAVNDNEVVYFVSVGQSGGMDAFYQSMSSKGRPNPNVR